MTRPIGRLLAAALLTSAGSRADVVILEPTADAFVAASNPASNYGGAGAIAAADAASPNGEFQSLLRFDTTGARAIFDAAFGPGQWQVISISLQVSPGLPTNPLFNPAAAGPLAISWLGRDDWIEGTGSPSVPTTDGVTFNDLPSLIAAGDEGLGVFNFDGSTSGTAAWNLALSPGLSADIHAGSLVTLRLHSAGAPVACLFRSHNYPVPASHPFLTITAGIVVPPCYANCDASSTPPVLNVLDFGCFLNHFATGCP
jgi:hypothetical protein